MGNTLLRHGTHRGWALLLFALSPTTQAQPPPQPTLALNASGTTLLRFGAASVALSPDGKTLASARMDDSSVVLRQMLSGKELWKWPGAEKEVVDSLAFSANGQILETRTVNLTEPEYTRTIRLREVGTGKELFKHTLPLEGVFAFSPDRKTVALSTGDGVDLVDTATKKRLRRHGWKAQEVLELTFSADGKLWASTHGFKREGRPVTRLWEVGADKAVLESPFSLKGPVSPDGKRLAAWTGLGICRGAAFVLWELGTGKATALTGASSDQTMGQVAFSPDGRWLVVMTARRGEDGKNVETVAELWAVPSGNAILTVALPGGVHSASFSADGKALLVAGEKHCLLQPLAPLGELAGSIALLTFSQDGKFLAAGDVDGGVHLWAVGAGKRLHRLEGHKKPVQAVAFSGDGEWLCSAGADAALGLWSVRTGRLQRRIDFEVKDWPRHDGLLYDRFAIKADPEAVHTLKFSPDGKSITASTAFGWRRWNAETGRELSPRKQ
jgi:WD40 repeat protein